MSAGRYSFRRELQGEGVRSSGVQELQNETTDSAIRQLGIHAFHASPPELQEIGELEISYLFCNS
jgi:hypothetical protein